MPKREYNKCKQLVLAPPIYKSTGIQYLIELSEANSLEFFGSKNLK